MNKIISLFFLLILFPIVSGVTFENGTIFFEYVSNTTVQLASNTIADEWDISEIFLGLKITNLSTDSKFTNINQTYRAKIGFYGLNNALVYNSSGNVACSNINSCDGNLNITAGIGHNIAALDNFNLTEGVSRQFSPLWFTSTSETGGTKTWNIASNVSSITNVLTILNTGNIECENIRSVTITPKNLASYSSTSYTCSNGVLTINDVNYEQSATSNQISIATFQIDQGFCSATMTGFSSFFKNVPIIAYLLGILLIVGFIVSIVYIVNNGVNFELPTLSTGGADYSTIIKIIFAIGLVGIIAVISIVAMNAFCVI